MDTEAKVVKTFSRFACQYDQYNQIQRLVASDLLSLLPLQCSFGMILDIGCGSGELYRQIEQKKIGFKTFYGLDLSDKMLSLHPNGENIIKLQRDFNQKDALCGVPLAHNTLILSSSALQWCQNLDALLKQLSLYSHAVFFAIFTSGTFKTLHQTAGICSPVLSLEEIMQSIQKYYYGNFSLKHYQLTFDSVEAMFRYIKMSGVSGGKQQITIQQTKKVLKEYPLDYLEFEVIFFKGEGVCL